MKKYFFLLMVLPLAACSTHWAKSGATIDDFNRDNYACQRDSLGLPNSPAPYRPALYPDNPYGTMQSAGDDLQGLSHNLADIAVRERMYQRCMESKGWRKQ